MKARAAAGETLVTMLAIALTVLSAWLLDPEPGAAVLGGMLALTLSRSQLERDWRGRLEAAIALPVIGVVAAVLGVLLLELPIVGATVYTLGLAGSVFIRRFGPVWRRLGALVALPFTALLVAPATVARTGPLEAVGWLMPVLVPLLAFVWVTLLQLGARVLRLLPGPAAAVPVAPPAKTDRLPRRLPASDRMAIQLLVALALAFVVGFLLFPGHWTWVVITVVVILFGTAGRVDAAVKGASRLLGAAAGSVIAFAPLAVEEAVPIGWRIAIAAIALTLGVFLRPFAYVWWALCFTVVLSLVQSFGAGADGAGGGFLLGERLLEILVGAVLAIAAAWFLLPVPTTDVIRKRMAELRDAAIPREDGGRDGAAIAAARRRLTTAAEPFLVLERLRLLPPSRRELVDRVKAILARGAR